MGWQNLNIPAVASAFAAWVALLLSILNIRTSRKALRLSEQQEVRRKPSLSTYLQEAFTSPTPSGDARVYALLVSISNKSDNNNSLAEATLHLTYLKAPNTHFTIKFPGGTGIPPPFNSRHGQMLPIPTRIDAHQVVVGWLFFKVERVILQDMKIEEIVVVLRDAHDNELKIAPQILREYSDESIWQIDPKEKSLDE